MTVRRLSVYTRSLQQLEEDGVKTISSQELAERFSLNSAQVRKDLAYFGEFGVRGIGYYVSGLKAELQRILGLDREWQVALVGFGNLGSALFHYKGFARQGFRISTIFDDDPAKWGKVVDGVTIQPMQDLPKEAKARIDLGGKSLDHRRGADDGQRHRRPAHGEILEGAPGLRPVVGVFRDPDLAHRIPLHPEPLAHRLSPSPVIPAQRGRFPPGLRHSSS